MQTLRYGSSGTSVKILQLALTRANFSPGEIDGRFGPRTQSAVMRFQAASGLAPDGVVGKNTWAALIPFLKGYTWHTIRQGDTYWGLARLYGTTAEAIARANGGLRADNLMLGTSIIIPFGFDVVPTNVPYTSELLDYIVDGLQVRYPYIRTGSIGRSVMGRPLYLLTMGTGATKVAYNASHHANEWITTPVLLKFMEDYAKLYSTGGTLYDYDVNDLYENVTLYMVPMVNPDGVDLVNGAIPSGDPYYQSARAISNRYPSVPFASGWKANIEGTDLNLNYPAGWEEAKKIKYALGFTSPAPRDFVGDAPLSAPESRAMYDFTIQKEPALTLSYHSQGKVIYWKYLDYEPEGSYAIAQEFGRVSGYSVEVTPAASGYAGYKDWFIQQFNRPGYTIEVGIGENPLPLSQFEEIYRDNMGILTLGMALVGVR